MQQDAHEFLNFLINHINEIILGESLEFFYVIFQICISYLFTAERQQNIKVKPNTIENGPTNTEPTWVHEIFQVIFSTCYCDFKLVICKFFRVY